MEMSQLRYFVTLSRLCNYSKAAEELFIAQPTLSQQIKRLEEELGVQLFERSTRKVVLTPIGQECVQYAVKTLEAADMLMQTAQEKYRKDQAYISLGVLTIYPAINISSMMRKFQEDYPAISLQLTFHKSVELVDMLLRKKLDAVFANVSTDELDKETLDKLVMDVFWEDRLHVVLSDKHPLYGRDTLAVEDILDERMLFNDFRSSVRLQLHQEVRRKGYALPKSSECPSLSNMFNFIQGNMGISVLTAGVAKSYLLPGMGCIPIEPPLRTKTALIMRKEGRTPALKQFGEYFRNNPERVPLQS